MQKTLATLALIVWSLVSAEGAVAQVYKCKRGGVLAYQDKPCPSGTQLGKITLEAAATGKPPSSSLSPPAPIPATPPAPPAPAILPAAANYLCQRYDGSTYYSGSNMPKRHYVAQSQIVAGDKSAGGGDARKVWVTDQCKEAPLQDACEHYNREIASIGKKQTGASGAELNALTREAKRLRTVSNSRCMVQR